MIRPVHFSIFRHEPIRGLTVLELNDFFARYTLFGQQQATDFYTLVIITSGSLDVFHNGQTETMSAGSILFVSPNQLAKLQNIDAKGFLLSFFEDFYTQEYSITKLLTVFRPLASTQARIMRPEEPIFEDVADTAELLLKKTKKAMPCLTTQAFNSLLNTIMVTLATQPEASQGFAEALDFAQLQKFVSLVEAHYFKEQNPIYYAKAIGISQEKLNHLTRNHFGLSTKKFIMKRVMLEVRNLLSTTNMQVAEIAYALNFADNSYFNKVFVKYHRMTPGKYRKLHKIHN